MMSAFIKSKGEISPLSETEKNDLFYSGCIYLLGGSVGAAYNCFRQITPGSVGSLFNMALCYEEGWCVEQNLKTAVEWNRKAALAGDAEAITKMGIAYEEDLDNAIAVLAEACAAVNERFAQVLDEQAHVLGVTELADSAVTIRMTFTALDWQQAVVERELRKLVKDTLDAKGVEISYPKLQRIPSP